MNKKIRLHSMLLDEIQKIIDASKSNFNSNYFININSILKIEKNYFLFKSKENINNFKLINNLVQQIIELSVEKNDLNVFIDYLNLYVKNTDFYLNKLQEGFPFETEFFESLSYYRKIINLIVSADMLNEKIMREIGGIQTQIIFSKQIMFYASNRILMSSFSKEKEKFSEINQQVIQERDLINSELFDSLKYIFRSCIKNNREIYSEMIIKNLRDSLFNETRRAKRNGLVEQLLELLINYLVICLEEENHLANILIYTFRDILDKIYDPNNQKIENKKIIVTEYLPIYKRYFLLANKWILKEENKFNLNIFKNQLEFFKDSLVFKDYEQVDRLLLSKLFFSVGCYCVENEKYKFLNNLIKYTDNEMKDYILVNQNPLLQLDLNDLLAQLQSTEYKSIDSENIKTILFIIFLIKRYNPKNKKELKDLFLKIKPNSKEKITLMKSIILHESQLKNLLDKKEKIKTLLDNLENVYLKMNFQKLIYALLEIGNSFEKKIKKYDERKEISKKKIESFIDHFFKAYNEKTNIDKICSKLKTKKKPRLLFNKIKEERIWFVDVSGTIAYSSDYTGTQLGRSLAQNEMIFFARELSKCKSIERKINKDIFEKKLNKDIEMLDDEIILLMPRNKYFMIRDYLRYDYEDKKPKEYLLIDKKRIDVFDYIDKENLNEAFLFQKDSIKWKRKVFSYKPVKGLDINIKKQIAEIKFEGYEDASEEDKKYITKKELIISTKWGYNIKINKNKLIVYKLSFNS